MAPQKTIPLTPAQALGYTVGDQFVVISAGTGFQAGDVVELCADDGTSFLLFRLVTRLCGHNAIAPGMASCYTLLKYVRKLEAQNPLQINPTFAPKQTQSGFAPTSSYDEVKPDIALSESKTVLDEAKAIVYGDRERIYGDPGRNLRHIASQWQLYIQQRYNLPAFTLSPEDVCYMMTDLKKCRQMNCAHRDNLVDGIGYLALLERL